MPDEGKEQRSGRATPVVSRNGAAAILCAVLLAMGAAYFLFGRSGGDILSGTTFIAKRGDLNITVTEGGSIEALESQEIRSRIKGHAGVKILTIVEEGYLVTAQDVAEGLLLVQLDSADLEDRLVTEEISNQSAQAHFIEKRAQYDIQVNQNQSDMSAAELTTKFALMDFEKFLGKEAVDLIIVTLNLPEKAAELERMKALGGILREAVIADQLGVDQRRGAIGPAVLAFDEREHRDALEGRAPLAVAEDHLDGRERAGRRLRMIGVVPGHAALLQELVHDVHVALLAGQLLHVVLEDRLGQAGQALLRGVGSDVAEVDRVLPNAEEVLDLSQDDLLARPAVVGDALEPRMLTHRERERVLPQISDKLVNVHRAPPCGRDATPASCAYPIAQ